MKPSPVLRDTTTADLTEVRYKCKQCGAEDSDNGLHGPSPGALDCWNCHSGRYKSLDEMIRGRIGMFPLSLYDKWN